MSVYWKPPYIYRYYLELKCINPDCDWADELGFDVDWGDPPSWDYPGSGDVFHVQEHSGGCIFCLWIYSPEQLKKLAEEAEREAEQHDFTPDPPDDY